MKPILHILKRLRRYVSLAVVAMSFIGLYTPASAQPSCNFQLFEVMVQVLGPNSTLEVSVFTPDGTLQDYSIVDEDTNGGCGLRAETNGSPSCTPGETFLMEGQEVECWYIGDAPEDHLLTILFEDTGNNFEAVYTYDVCQTGDRENGFGFYCSQHHYAGGSTDEDTHFKYDPVAGEIHVIPILFGSSVFDPENPSLPDGIGDLFPDDRWVLPYAMHDICELTGETCTEDHFKWDVFISPQAGDPGTGATATPRLRSWELGHNVLVQPHVISTDVYIWDLEDEAVYFDPGKKLLVEGELEVTGMTLTESLSGSGWDGVEFADGSSGELTDAIVSNTAPSCVGQTCDLGIAISVYNADVTLSGTTVSDNDVAMAVLASGEYADLLITDQSVISLNQGTGVYAASQASVLVDGFSEVTLNGSGVAASGKGTTFTLHEAIIEANDPGWGVRAINQGLVRFADFNQAYSATSFVTDHEVSGGLYAHNDGYIQAGASLDEISCSVYCNNRIEGNSPGLGPLDARSTGGSVLYAQANYWAVPSSSQLDTYVDGSSSLYIDPILLVPPSFAPGGSNEEYRQAGPLQAGWAAGGAFQPGTHFRGSSSPSRQATENAMRAAIVGDYQAAFTLIRDAFGLADTADDRRFAFGAGLHLLQTNQPPAVMNWLEAKAALPGAAQPWALRALSVGYEAAGRPMQAAEATRTLIDVFPDTDHERFGLAAGVRLAVKAERMTLAEELLARLMASFPDASVTEEMVLLVDLAGGTVPDAARVAQVTSGGATAAHLASIRESVPGVASLGAAHPNPSRGAASLSLTLDASADVRVDVYDMLGRRVATLADGVYEAGSHELRLEDAALPAGIYLVKAVVNNEHALTQRLTLVR